MRELDSECSLLSLGISGNRPSVTLFGEAQKSIRSTRNTGIPESTCVCDKQVLESKSQDTVTQYIQIWLQTSATLLFI